MKSSNFQAALTLTIIAMAFSACGPSEEELEATATQFAADIFSTQTAEAPTITPTLIPTHTPTLTLTPTTTPTITPTPTPDLVTLFAGVWHRLNAAPGFTPQHQVNDCQGVELWTCMFNNQPEPDLGFGFEQTTGQFEGSVIPEWRCPNWFPNAICKNAIYIVGGKTFFKGAGPGLEVEIEYIVTEVGDEHILYEYWVNRFACPWYRTFDEALAANPFPYHRDCLQAP
jgi:hypothetical protein